MMGTRTDLLVTVPSLRTGMRNWKGRNGRDDQIKVKVKRCRLIGKSWCNPLVQVGGCDW